MINSIKEEKQFKIYFNGTKNEEIAVHTFTSFIKNIIKPFSRVFN